MTSCSILGNSTSNLERVVKDTKVIAIKDELLKIYDEDIPPIHTNYKECIENTGMYYNILALYRADKISLREFNEKLKKLSTSTD